MIQQRSPRPLDEMLTLKEDGTVAWTKDARWTEMKRLAEVIENTKANTKAKAKAKL